MFIEIKSDPEDTTPAGVVHNFIHLFLQTCDLCEVIESISYFKDRH